jgi:RHS repeat-associated protein
MNRTEYKLYYFNANHLGSGSLITDISGNTYQTLAYAPFGEELVNQFSGDYDEPYKFTGYERDRESGLYYFGQRYEDPTISQFYSVDRFAEKFPWQSPYCVASNNPVNFIDVNGDSTAVLNLGGAIGHTAMLVQNDEDKWQYYSFNSTWVYEMGGSSGGKGYHDLGEKTFNSVEEFMNSPYNAEGSKEQVANNQVNNYGFKEAFILPTTPEQDKAIREAFTNIANTENYGANNQCAQVVQKSLNAAGVQTSIPYVKTTIEYTDRKHGDVFYKSVNAFRNPYWPSDTFRAIINNNPNGTLIKR